MTPGATTAAELRSAPEVVAGMLEELDAAAAELAPRVRAAVGFVGCGSSHLLGGLAASVLRSGAGVAATAVVASEVGPAEAAGLAGHPVVAISRSGRTTETVEAVAAARAGGASEVVAVVCDVRSPLAAAADAVVALTEAAEQAVAQTRSVAAVLAFALLLAERAAGRQGGAAALQRSLDVVAQRHDAWAAEAARLAQRWVGLDGGGTAGRLVLLGGAERWWLAREGVLKATEMARAHALAERVLEVPHGMIEGLTTADTVVVLPAPEGVAARREAAAVQRLRDLVGTLVVVGVDAFTAGDAPVPALPGQLHALHLLALALADANGVDADRPVRLAPYLVLDP